MTLTSDPELRKCTELLRCQRLGLAVATCRRCAGRKRTSSLGDRNKRVVVVGSRSAAVVTGCARASKQTLIKFDGDALQLADVAGLLQYDRNGELHRRVNDKEH